MDMEGTDRSHDEVIAVSGNLWATTYARQGAGPSRWADLLFTAGLITKGISQNKSASKQKHCPQGLRTSNSHATDSLPKVHSAQLTQRTGAVFDPGGAGKGTEPAPRETGHSHQDSIYVKDAGASWLPLFV